MSVKNPQTVHEWRQYIQTLDESNVTRKAMAANSLNFVETLQEEGYSASEIEDILVLFAERMVELDRYVPGNAAGTYTSYQTLLGSKAGEMDPEGAERPRKELSDYDADDEDWI